MKIDGMREILETARGQHSHALLAAIVAWLNPR